MIADALPDRWGNAIFDAWLRDHHIRHSDVNPVDRLSFTGKRALGALEFEPAHSLGDDLAFDTMASGLGIDTEVIAMVKKEINSRLERVVIVD